MVKLLKKVGAWFKRRDGDERFWTIVLALAFITAIAHQYFFTL